MEEVNSTVKMVSEIGEEFPIVGKLFSIFNKIYEIADQAKQNIKNCKKAATRCKTYEKIICECIVAYKENGVDLSDSKHNKGVRDLKGSVEELKDLLEKYSKEEKNALEEWANRRYSSPLLEIIKNRKD